MNSDILKGKWLQLRGSVQKQWGKLTDDDLDQVNGDMTRLSGIVQERYGYTREEAQSVVDKFVHDFDDSDLHRNMSGTNY